MPHRRTSVITLRFAHELRAAPTEAERKLWSLLRSNALDQIHFRRQHAIGPYVADFCAPRAHLIIELDGGQHSEQVEYDEQRTAYLRSKGYQVLRFWNREVLSNPECVIQVILDALKMQR